MQIQEAKMASKSDNINDAVWKAINKTINKFREHPDYFFTESDIHSYFYHALYSSDHTESNLNVGEIDIYCIHREYPTNFRYKKLELLNKNYKKPYDLSLRKGKRGNYDIAVLDPVFIKNANSKQDIVNKRVELLEIRTKNNKYFVNSKELLFAIEFKYVINNSKKFVEEVKMDNKKLLFAKDFGGACEAVNLVFCNVDTTKYTGRIISEVRNADKKILSIFIHPRYKERGKGTPGPIKNKTEPKIKYFKSF